LPFLISDIYYSHFTGINVLSQLEAAAVNLVAKEKPADVYTEIAVRYIKFISAVFRF